MTQQTLHQISVSVSDLTERSDSRMLVRIGAKAQEAFRTLWGRTSQLSSSQRKVRFQYLLVLMELEQAFVAYQDGLIFEANLRRRIRGASRDLQAVYARVVAAS